MDTLPRELRNLIRSLILLIPLYQQWRTIVDEMLRQKRCVVHGWIPALYNVNKHLLDGHHWLCNLRRLRWYGNRIACVQFTDAFWLRRRVYEGEECYEIINDGINVYVMSSEDAQYPETDGYTEYVEQLVWKGGMTTVLAIDEAKLQARSILARSQSGIHKIARNARVSS